jgi:hypothetical protein
MLAKFKVVLAWYSTLYVVPLRSSDATKTFIVGPRLTLLLARASL